MNLRPTAECCCDGEAMRPTTGPGLWVVSRTLSEGLQSGLGASQYQRMDIVGPFVGIHCFQVHHMADDVKLIRDAIAAVHVPRCTSDVECFSAIVTLHHGNRFMRGGARIQ